MIATGSQTETLSAVAWIALLDVLVCIWITTLPAWFIGARELGRDVSFWEYCLRVCHAKIRYGLQIQFLLLRVKTNKLRCRIRICLHQCLYKLCLFLIVHDLPFAIYLAQRMINSSNDQAHPTAAGGTGGAQRKESK